MFGRARQRGCLTPPNQGHLTSAAALGSQKQGSGSQTVSDKNRAPKAWVLAAAIGEFKHTDSVHRNALPLFLKAGTSEHMGFNTWKLGGW